MESSGWQPPPTGDFDSFWKGMLEVGGWWDPVYYHEEWSRAFKTPSGKFELFSRGVLELAGGAGGSGIDAVRDPMPWQEALPPDSKVYPLALEVYTPGSVGGLAGRTSWCRSIAGAHVNMEWNTWVELNSKTATSLGLRAGDPVRLSSKRGSLRAVVALNPATPPDTAAVPAGLLATDTDPKPGGDPQSLLKPRLERLTGRQVRRLARVAIQKV
jgi:anaerobic selenocysteine-containing dehydrogenase